jgi:hypothetical protein
MGFGLKPIPKGVRRFGGQANLTLFYCLAEEGLTPFGTGSLTKKKRPGLLIIRAAFELLLVVD